MSLVFFACPGSHELSCAWQQVTLWLRFLKYFTFKELKVCRLQGVFNCACVYVCISARTFVRAWVHKYACLCRGLVIVRACLFLHAPGCTYISAFLPVLAWARPCGNASRTQARPVRSTHIHRHLPQNAPAHLRMRHQITQGHQTDTWPQIYMYLHIHVYAYVIS